jgi:aspartyl-tRNA(Asn)/glutamyl-tRNA(Gln) amidotransferase subunit A
MTLKTVTFEPMAQLASLLREGAVTPSGLVESLLTRIGTMDSRVHSFLRLTPERAFAEARIAEQRLRSGTDPGPLCGIPYSVKDLFDVEGVPTTAGSRLFESRRAVADCEAVRRLTAAGMCLLGKNHTIQLAYGVVGINNDQGTPLNPWSREPRVTGGSSTGSAAAVAAGLTPLSLGTDTGGSVRIPAALCGIVGLKTTVGRLSRCGVYPLSATYDSVGTLTRTVEDAAWAFDALQGPDAGDPATRDVPPIDATAAIRDGVEGLRLAFGETLFFDDVEPSIRAAVRAAGETLRGLGARVDGLALPEIAELWADRTRPYVIGYEGLISNRDLLATHALELDPVVVNRMVLSKRVSEEDYGALLVRLAAFRERLFTSMRDTDALLVPATMITAPLLVPLQESFDAYLDVSLKLNRNQGIGNLLHLCGVTLPCGFDGAGLPIGLTIYAKPFREDVALRVAHAFERATDWHRRRPEL